MNQEVYLRQCVAHQNGIIDYFILVHAYGSTNHFPELRGFLDN